MLSATSSHHQCALYYFEHITPESTTLSFSEPVEWDLSKITEGVQAILKKTKKSGRKLDKRIKKYEWNLIDSSGASIRPQSACDLQAILNHAIQKQQGSLTAPLENFMSIQLLSWGIKTDLIQAQEVLFELDRVCQLPVSRKKAKKRWQKKEHARGHPLCCLLGK